MRQQQRVWRAIRRHRRWSTSAQGRRRSGWAGLAAGVVGVLVAVAVLVSVLALIGSGDAATAGALRVPVGRIAVAVFVGYVVALVLLVVAGASRSSARTWVAAMLAVAVAIAVSVYPLFATAAAAVDQAREVLPWIADLIRRVTG